VATESFDDVVADYGFGDFQIRLRLVSAYCTAQLGKLIRKGADGSVPMTNHPRAEWLYLKRK